MPLPKSSPTPPQDGPTGPQDHPKTAQEGPKTAKEPAKTGQEGPKRGTTNRKFQPIRSNKLQGGPQEAPKRPPRRPKRPPRGPKEAPRGPNTAPKRLRNCFLPKDPSEHPIGLIPTSQARCARGIRKGDPKILDLRSETPPEVPRRLQDTLRHREEPLRKPARRSPKEAPTRFQLA